MRYAITDLPSVVPGEAPDLRAELLERRKRQQDVLEMQGQIRFIGVGSRLGLRFGSRDMPLGAGARVALGQQLGLGRAPAGILHLDRLNDWVSGLRDVLVRLEGNEVRAVLPGDVRVLDLVELLDVTLDHLRRLPVRVRLEHCEEERGELYLTAVAPELAGELAEGDYLYGGFYLSHSETTLSDTEACVRIYRVACRNGALMDAVEGQRLVLPRRVRAGAPDPYAGWEERLGRVVARSFDGGEVDLETRRFRSTTSQILATPYELLLHLAAQGLMTPEEQERIQREFNTGRDDSMFALINAVTFQAHVEREGRDWARAFALERLGGEILRGDHQPPVLEPVHA